MQKRVIVSCSTFVIVATLAFAEDKSGETGLDVPAPSKAKEEKASAPETIIYSARGVPVRELAETLGNVYGNEPSMRVVADSASNVLVIRADAKSREGILKLLEELDKPLQSMVVPSLTVSSYRAYA